MTRLVPLKCLGCGAPLETPKGQVTISCKYCNAIYFTEGGTWDEPTVGPLARPPPPPTMASPSAQTSTEVIGYLHSGRLSKHRWGPRAGGYALYVTESEIAGRKKFTLGSKAVLRVENPMMRSLVYEDPDFIIKKDEIQEILLKRNRFQLLAGHLTIKTDRQIVRLVIGPAMSYNEFQFLAGMLETFCSGKVYLQ